MDNLLFLTASDSVSPSAMSVLLKSLGEVFGAVITHIATVCSTIVNQPLLLLTVGFLFIGGIIGIFGRLLSRG